MDYNIDIIFEDENLLVVNKPPNIVVFSEKNENCSLIEILIKKHPGLKSVGMPPRYGIVHRLDKETSGILLVAKNYEALNFLQKQFKRREVLKKYSTLVTGIVNQEEGEIKTLIGRSHKKGTKQKVYLFHSPLSKKARPALTKYRVVKRYSNYTLIRVVPKTGRKHQIRVHFSHLGHPIAGDKKYCFKKQKSPKELRRHFLHADYLKIRLLNGNIKEFKIDLPGDLEKTLKNLN